VLFCSKTCIRQKSGQKGGEKISKKKLVIFLRESNTTLVTVQANAKIFDQMPDMIMNSIEK